MAEHGYLQDEGPLPEQALRTLAWINGKDARVKLLEELLDEALHVDPEYGPEDYADWKRRAQDALTDEI